MKRALVVLLALACAPPPPEDAGPPEPDAGPPLPTAFAADGGPDTSGREPAPDELLVIDVGTVPAAGGRTPAFALDIPAGAAGFTLYAYAHPGHHVVLSSLISPSGETLVDAEPPEELGAAEAAVARGFPGPFFSPNRAGSSLNEGAFLIPNTGPGFEAGRWAARFDVAVRGFDGNTFSADPVDDVLRVVALIHPPAARPVVVDVALYLTGGSELTAASAPDDARLSDALDEARRLLLPAELQLGEVVFRDIDPALQTVVLEEDICEGGDLDRLLGLGAPELSGRLSIFLVERFECIALGGIDVGGGVGGLAGGSPGTARTTGTAHGGVAIATRAFIDDPATLGKVIAHESGHFLGLFHTMENDGFGGPRIFDVIDDTPNDPDAARENLMHFAAAGDGLSDDQGAVLRNGVLPRPVSP